jgi:hypothetical protein
LKKGFIIDLIATFPIDLCITSHWGFLFLYLRLLRLSNVPKLIARSPYYKNMRRSLEEYLGLGQAISAIFIFGGLLLSWLHIQACAIYLLGRVTDFRYSTAWTVRIY